MKIDYMATNLKAFINRLKTDTIYMKDEQEDCLVKHTPGGGFTVKHRGGSEGTLDAKSDIAMRAVYGMKEVTENEYNKFR